MIQLNKVLEELSKDEQFITIYNVLSKLYNSKNSDELGDLLRSVLTDLLFIISEHTQVSDPKFNLEVLLEYDYCKLSNQA